MCISMKSIYIYALIVTCLIVKGHSETLQCYGCDECEKLDDSMIQSCPTDVTTPSPSAEKESSSETNVSTTPVEDLLGDTEEANNISAEVNYKSVMTKRSARNTVSYQCFSVVKVDNEKRLTKKGCVEVPENEKGCDVLEEVEVVSKENCMVCSENKCNSSIGLKYSIVTVFVAAIMKAFL